MARAAQGRVKRRVSWKLLIVAAVAAQLTVSAAPVGALQVHRPPIAVADVYGFVLPGPFSVAAPGVLANDSWTGKAVVTVKQRPRHGRVHLARDGSFTYEPRPGFVGTDSFVYRLTSGRYRGSARVELRVGAANVVPVATADAYSTFEDSAIEVAAPGLLANDSYAAGSPLQIEVVRGPGGSIDVQPDGSFTFEPFMNADGDDSFTYRIGDGITWSEPALVNIDVIAVNDPPFVEGEQYETSYETTLVVDAPGVLANDFDPIEFDGLTASGPIQGPAHGTVVLQSNGSFTYTPDAGYSGTDGFSYLVSDSQPGGTASAEITVAEP